MSRAIPNVRRQKTALVSNTQSTPAPAPTRPTTRGPDPALSTATVEPLRPIKRRSSLKEMAKGAAQKVVSASKRVGTFKEFPKDKVIDGQAETWDGEMRAYYENGYWPTHKRADSDSSSLRTIVPARSSSIQRPALSIRSVTPPPGSVAYHIPDISVHPSKAVPRSLSPVFSESVASSEPLIDAFAADDLSSVGSSAQSQDAHLAGRILQNAGMRLSRFESQQSLAKHFVDDFNFLEEEKASVVTRASSAVLPTPIKGDAEREGATVSKASSRVVEFYEATGIVQGSKGEFELTAVKTKRTSNVSSVRPATAVPRHLRSAKPRKYGEELTPDDSISQWGSTTSSTSRTTSASGTSAKSTHKPKQHKRVAADLTKASKNEIASFKEARKQLEDDDSDSGRSSASTATFHTAYTSTTSISDSASVATSTTITTSTGSIRTPRAHEFPSVPLGDIQQIHRDNVEQLRCVVAGRNVDLDVEAVYRRCFNFALNVQLKAAAEQAYADTLRAMSDVMSGSVSPSGVGKLH